MKKIVGVAAVLFAFVAVSCGGGHVCDAYNKVDYSKYKADHARKLEVRLRKH